MKKKIIKAPVCSKCHVRMSKVIYLNGKKKSVKNEYQCPVCWNVTTVKAV